MRNRLAPVVALLALLLASSAQALPTTGAPGSDGSPDPQSAVERWLPGHELLERGWIATLPPPADRAPDRDRPSAGDAGPLDRVEPDGEGDTRLPPGTTSPEGFEVAGGSGRAGQGTAIRFTVELEPEVDADLDAVVAEMERALFDPRSWTADHTLIRVDDPAEAAIRLVLATPGTVDRLCAEAGLDTAGAFSCWNGRLAALNALRWEKGASAFDDLDVYRRYLVNHEFGHGLGYGHVHCPGSGPAPVMMQQTKGTGACEPNGWPYP